MIVYKLDSLPHPSLSDYNCNTEQSSILNTHNQENQENRCPNTLTHLTSIASPNNKSFQSLMDLDGCVDLNLRSIDAINDLQTKRPAINQISQQLCLNNKQDEVSSRAQKHERRFGLPRSSSTGPIPQNMIWQFDLALNEKIAERIQQSLNNQSKVLAFYQVHLHSMLYKIFRRWKGLVEAARGRDDNITTFISSRQSKVKEKCFQELKLYARERQLSFLNRMKAEAFYIRNKLGCLLSWKQAVMYGKEDTCCTKEEALKADLHRDRRLLRKSYQQLKSFQQSMVLQRRLRQMGELFRRRVLLSKGFRILLVEEHHDKFLPKINKIGQLRVRRVFRKLKCQLIQEKKQLCLLAFLSKSRMKRFETKLRACISFQQTRRRQILHKHLLKARFDEFAALSSLRFSADVLDYSAQQYHEHRLLRDAFGCFKKGIRK